MVQSSWVFPWQTWGSWVPPWGVTLPLLLLLPGELLNVESLHLLPTLGVEDQLWRLTGHLLENTTLKLWLKVPIDEVLHLRELGDTGSDVRIACSSPYSDVILCRTRQPPGRWCCPRTGPRPPLQPCPRLLSTGVGGRSPTATSLWGLKGSGKGQRAEIICYEIKRQALLKLSKVYFFSQCSKETTWH